MVGVGRRVGVGTSVGVGVGVGSGVAVAVGAEVVGAVKVTFTVACCVATGALVVVVVGALGSTAANAVQATQRKTSEPPMMARMSKTRLLRRFGLGGGEGHCC